MAFVKSKREDGVVAVEFGLILPLFLLIFFGIVEFSIALYNKAVITNASREAARAGIALKKPKLTDAEIINVANNYCQGKLITFGKASNCNVSPPTGWGGSFDTPLTVTVSYSYSGLALGAIFNPLTGPLNLTATTVMHNE
ncbi:TadE family protein [Cupriavidus necator]|uniref:TadE family protein n=1 Tax=Cupriavidus necator TaxID=106590 RepID=A0A1U9URP5_CUPNE|nr:TadE/TadG family type IV pilus assembly protein [Cupriavidus necator]AQV94805.1 TadE family protein [Cupriavidus necator]